MNRRTLHRAFAAAVAIAAISPLFAVDSTGCAKGSQHLTAHQQNQHFQTSAHLHH